MSRLVWFLVALAAVASAQPKKYDGPQPPKPDLPYLKHADNLVPTDASEAKEEKKKDTTTYVIDGATAKAQTPLASPIFIMQADKLVADKIGLYKLDVKNGHRELLSSPKKAAAIDPAGCEPVGRERLQDRSERKPGAWRVFAQSGRIEPGFLLSSVLSRLIARVRTSRLRRERSCRLECGRARKSF
jgi:hypothetical protein